MDLFDIAMKYGQRRLDNALQPFNDTEGYIEDRFGNATPKSTTINYNEDGTQTITNKVDVSPEPTPAPQPFGIQAQPQAQAFGIQPPAMPATMPTAPVAPMANQPTAMPQPTLQPTAQTTPPVNSIPGNVAWSDIQGQEVELPGTRQRLGQPEPMVTAPAVPGPTPTPAPAVAEAPAPVAPVAPPAAGAAPQPNVAPTGAVTTPVTAPSVTAEPTPQPEIAPWQRDIETAGSNPTKLAAIAGNESYPEEARKLASERWRKELLKKDEEAKLDRLVSDAAKGDAKASNDLTRYMRSKSDEGSYIKAILLARLGLTDLAKEEQQKLAGGTFENTIVNNQAYTVERNNLGAVSRAWDSSGQAVDDNTVARINASAMPVKGSIGQAGSTRVRDTQGTEWSVVPTSRGSIYYDTKGNQGVPVGKTVPITAGSDWVGQNATQHNKTVSDYIAKYGVDAVIKQGGKWMNPVTGEMTDVNKEGYNPYMPGGVLKAPEAAPAAQPAPAKKPVSYEGPVAPTAPGMMTTAAPVEETATAQPAVYRATGGMPIMGYQGAPQTQLSNGEMMPVALADLDTQKKLDEKSAETDIGVRGKRSESYNKYLDETVAADAKTGYEISGLRKRQRDILTRPGVNTDLIFGLYNAAGDSPNAQKGTIVRDIIGGWFGDKNEVSKRLADLNLDRATRSALEEYVIQNAEINKRTLKSVAGGGSVSDAEQEANRKSNVDPTTIPSLAGFNSLAQSQFNGDMAAYKGDWAADQKFTNTLQLEKAWRRESSRLSEMYKRLAEERIKFINENGNTTAAVREGYKRFPIPEYDVNTGTWKKTKPLKDILGR